MARLTAHWWLGLGEFCTRCSSCWPLPKKIKKEECESDEKEAIVMEGHAGEHLFVWALKQWQHLGSHQFVKALARQGNIQVNGRSVADFHRLSVGDHVTLRLDPHVLSLSHTFLRSHRVSAEHQGSRLEGFCKIFFSNLLTSRKAIRQAVKCGSIRVNGQQVEHTRVLQEGASVEMSLPAIDVLRSLCPAHCWPRIVYEDEVLAVVWKEPNVKSMGGWQTAENGARLQVKASCHSDAFEERLKSVHRLDKPVAGLMLMAKTSTCHRRLMTWLKEGGQISKIYRAIVQGDPLPLAQKLEERSWSFQVASDVDGKKSLTYGRKLEDLSCGFSLLELSPITGRRHQLRIHMASLGCPIINDSEYGVHRNPKTPAGLLLSSVALRFPHPVTGEVMSFQEEEPQHFKNWREHIFSLRG